MTLGHIELFSAEGAVVLLLLLFSLVTWGLGLLKFTQYRLAQRRDRRFRAAFWQQDDVSQTPETSAKQPGSLANLALAAVKAPERISGQLALNIHLPDRVERALQQQIQRERRSLESGLAVLASIGSTSPFIGLFGTVWGIMAALQEIGLSGSASLDTVAGPIGNALIATGIGIAVAVPAVLIYNYFLRRLKLAVADMDDFAHDVYSVMQANDFHVSTFQASTEPSSAAFSVKNLREVV
ncbi:MotA/TolQ/ExbB proton channel family protein [Pectobacterium parmentieri]|uniref:MotA/TolQ/ExbB proton channel family protein n=1 Tax=Pectobacterium parmentieri TaxID=1905730 RepID=UPI0001B1083A|nr:MotA/TolQ/ExbB proton channel family protein [Pectobacterium parmentieri]ACX90024.1 MotA/TolQ/ExbB proton channel [Pectobacterium parmentieri WPP163]AYH03406.1 MotA/TolQ/ExbB proton channel family protein [Pectobacterium parmentieri]AYH29663.1 MotA/TolQ/ExbB proton channel family protein [Pectobacterium parmentieri]AYH34081.1 MotA/TolQ/ExbB proton channel family protein [Pectobacterium parmentieri]MBI0518506.1 MotA/TolQ/ExbB proton channel family protein [Pectobacterium parmentieri]